MGNGRDGGCSYHNSGSGGYGCIECTSLAAKTSGTPAATTSAAVTIGGRLELHRNGVVGGSPTETARRDGDAGGCGHGGYGGVMITRSEHKAAAAGYAGSRLYTCAALLFVAMAVLCVAAPTTAGNEFDGVGGDEADAGTPELCGTPKDLPLVGTKGVITTPNFPGPFTVPIKCEWVIQADASAIETTIEVYFTQLFVTDGLTITEYSQYPPDFGFVTVREVFNKSHITQYGQSMVSTLPYLVIRFQLDRLQGNHIRVHDDLMDVYGFNITYEMRPAGNERSDVCSLYQCSYSGNCLGNADLT